MAWQVWRLVPVGFQNICLALLVIGCIYYGVDGVQPQGVADEPVENDDVDDDFQLPGAYGLPGVQHEIRFAISGGSVQCWFQYLRKDAQLHISFQVLHGADKNINVKLTSEAGIVLESLEWTSDGNFAKTIDDKGIYSICFDNSMSTFSTKLIYFYMLAYVQSDWHKYSSEVQSFHGSVENFTKTLEVVNQKVNDVKVYQAKSRQHVINDWYTVTGNNYWVGTCSIGMCVVIVLTSALQVYFVRRLFNVHGTGAKVGSKPRA